MPAIMHIVFIDPAMYLMKNITALGLRILNLAKIKFVTEGIILTQILFKTRLISIESQPKKIVVVVGVFIGVAVVIHVFVVVIYAVDPRNIPLKFG